MLMRVFKNALSLIVATIMDKLVYVLIFILIARKLSKQDFGNYSLFLALMFIGGMVVNFGMDGFIVREVAKDRSCAKVVHSNAMVLTLIFSLLAWPLVVGIAVFLNYGPEVVFLLSFGGTIFVLVGIGQVSSAIIRAYERMEILAIVGFCTSIMALALNALVLWVGGSLMGLAVVFVAVEGIKSVILTCIVHRRFVPVRFQFDKTIIVRILKLTVPFALLVAYGALFHRLDLLMVGWLRPSEEVAIYSVAARFADLLAVMSGSFVGAFYPVLSAKTNSSNEELWQLYNDSIGIFVVLGFGAALGLFVLAKPIIILLFGEKYVMGTMALRWLAWAFLFGVLSGPIGILLLAVGDQMKRLLVLSVSILSINIILNLWLIPLYGYNGAAVATFLSTLLGFVGRMILSKKYFGQVFNLFRIAWRASLASLLMVAVLTFFSALHVAFLVILGSVTYLAALALLGEFRQSRYNPLLAKIAQIGGRH